MADNKIDNSDKVKSDKYNNDWDIGKIFWGLLLVMIGGLALANNFGIVKVYFGDIWRLWPLLIIAAGLSIISIRSVVWRIVMVIFAIFSLAAVAWVVLGNYSIPSPIMTYESVIEKSSNSIEQAEISIKAGASSLNVNTTDQSSVVETRLQSNIAKLSKESNVFGNTQRISLSMDMKNNRGFLVGDIRNVLDVNLTRNLPLTLKIDTGASNINADMSMARLKAITIKTGASGVTLKLGEKELLTDVNIESGISSILIKVPNNVGIRLELENGLTSNSLADLNKVDGNILETTGYSQSRNKVKIMSKIGLSSFTIERY